MTKTFSITDKKVLEALGNSSNKSKLIQDAILYYLESIEEEHISREIVKDIVIDVLKDIVVSGPVSNHNYLGTEEQLDDDIKSIMDIE